jgi:Xaa-Pro aminopeptidase
MLEEPSIIQMNIDHYRTILNGRPTDEQRARVEFLLARAHDALAEAISRLARTINPEAEAETVVPAC